MPKFVPYKPLVLRLFHGINAFLAVAALITGFLVYDSWDGRFGQLSLTVKNRALIDIHGTFAFLLFWLFFGFLIVNLKLGKNYLTNAKDLSKLNVKVGENVWWYRLQRVVNTTIFLALILSLATGKMQDENWLPQGEVNHIWYYLHLIAWLITLIALLAHLLTSAKVGGKTLFISMFNNKYRPQDNPKLWPDKIRAWLKNPRW